MRWSRQPGKAFKKILVTLYHLSGHIEAFFGNGQRWGVALDYLLQRDAWGSAGLGEVGAAHYSPNFLW
ncbi:MAG: hypothetical protein M5U34_39605 [Chloroflexi bacterium]|nr:hypothetical protein [Chloroflexota bacterium]